MTATQLPAVDCNVWDPLRHAQAGPDENILAVLRMHELIVLITQVELLTLVLMYRQAVLAPQVRALKPEIAVHKPEKLKHVV